VPALSFTSGHGKARIKSAEKQNTGRNGIMNTAQLEIAVARHVGYRDKLIIPNVSWGLLHYECDMLVVQLGSRMAWEIELKTSASDIKADLKKSHGHFSKKIKRFSFAVPEKLVDCEYLPKDCGLLTVGETDKVKTIRPPRINKSARPLTEAEINKLYHLGCMRIWTLKEALLYKKYQKYGVSK
jgi:hypothetical protein